MVLLFQCFNSISILCLLNLFIYLYSVFFFFIFIFLRKDDEGTKRQQSLHFFYISFVWMCIPCLLYSHLLDLPYISFVHSFKFCNNFMWTYHSFLYDGLCMSVHVHIVCGQDMSIEHWLKRIHIKSTQLQKNTFLNSMRSLSLFIPLSLCVCQIYLHIKIYIQYDYSAFLMRTAIHHMCVSVFNLNVYSLGTDTATATGIADSFSACGWTFDRVFPFKLHF